jgi:hypothetical protein
VTEAPTSTEGTEATEHTDERRNGGFD